MRVNGQSGRRGEQGHRIKYYLRVQYAVTQMTFLQGNSNISLRANE